MTTHTLKCWPEYFWPVVDGRKKFDIRSEADRLFEEGDVLLLREYDPHADDGVHSFPHPGSGYTGASFRVRVTYILRDSQIFLRFLPENYACMSIEPVANDEEE
jgi:hypothetical protein